MKKLKFNKGYNWQYVTIGGVARVKIETGVDIAHLPELDQKKWTVLSCPTSGLEMDPVTLNLLDEDKDGKIRVGEVISASKWLCSVLKNPQTLISGEPAVALDNFNTETGEGARLKKSAEQILDSLGLAKDVIRLEDAADQSRIYAAAKFNGDGIVIPATAGSEEDGKLVSDALACIGGKTDRGGETGADAEIIEKFYAACADYAAWREAGVADKAILPYGDNTAAALAACEALSDKVSDFFMRCKLIKFNEACAGAVDVSVEKIAALAGQNIVTCGEEITNCPLARPSADGKLVVDAVNPAWQKQFEAFRTLVLDVKFKGEKSIDEATWLSILAGFDAYKAWMGTKKGGEVEALGLDRVKEILAAGRKDALLAVAAEDLSHKDEADAIDAVKKLLYLHRDFFTFLKNYVIFEDFYTTKPGVRAIFEAGNLFIDERCCKLCIKVADMGAHANMPSLSGMFLIYCKCTSRVKNETMDIVAVMTSGNTRNLRVGKNAIFYDRNGLDWDATVTKIVDNPINVRQAFWSPYRKLGNFISEKITKSAAEKEVQSISNLQNQTNTVTVAPAGSAKQAFDIAKFAGIFAAIGLALGAIGGALSSLGKAVFALGPIWTLVVVVLIMLLISGPSCLLAWLKLRKRNLGPVLNANGWAINSSLKVNALFGKTLTSTAKYPVIHTADPFKPKKPLWKKILCWLVAIVVVAVAVLYFTDNLGLIGIDIHPGAIASTVEAVSEDMTTSLQAAMDSSATVQSPAAAVAQ